MSCWTIISMNIGVEACHHWAEHNTRGSGEGSSGLSSGVGFGTEQDSCEVVIGKCETAFLQEGNEGSRSYPAVDHPRYAESIDSHATSRSPESLLERHRHRPVLRQRVENAFCLCLAVEIDRYRKASWFFITIRRGVATHQGRLSDNQRGVNDSIAHF